MFRSCVSSIIRGQRIDFAIPYRQRIFAARLGLHRQLYGFESGRNGGYLARR